MAPLEIPVAKTRLLVHGVILFQLSDQGPDEARVVDPVFVGPGAAVAGVPGEEAVLPAPRSVGIDGDETLPVRLPAEARHACHLLPVAASAVQNEDHGPGLVLAVGCRQVDKERPHPAVVAKREQGVLPLAAFPECRAGCEQQAGRRQGKGSFRQGGLKYPLHNGFLPL